MLFQDRLRTWQITRVGSYSPVVHPLYLSKVMSWLVEDTLPVNSIENCSFQSNDISKKNEKLRLSTNTAVVGYVNNDNDNDNE